MEAQENPSHKQQNNYSVSDRVSHEEYGNVHLDFFNDKMISGIFIVLNLLQNMRRQLSCHLPTILIERKKLQKSFFLVMMLRF